MVDFPKKPQNKKIRILPQSIIDHYSQFRNKNPLKVSHINGIQFELDESYEIMDSSVKKQMIFLLKFY